MPVEVVAVAFDGENLEAYGARHEEPYLDLHGDTEVRLGASGLPCNGTIREPVTVYDVTFTEDTPARLSGGVLMLDGSHPTVHVRARIEE